ncbi:MAG: flagellar biosynthesis protein FlgN [Paracoccaceae bacterium]
MSDESTEGLIDPLEALIDEERIALLNGDLDGLNRLLDRKERLIAAVAAADLPDPGPIRRIKAKLARNQALLESAMAGIRSVHDRLRLLREARESLRTYDRSGQEQRYETTPERQVERRA